MEVLVILNMLVIIAVFVWLMRLENKLKSLKVGVESKLNHNKNLIMVAGFKVDDVKNTLGKIKEEPKKQKLKKYQLTLTELSNGAKKVYAYKGVWAVFENSIVFWDSFGRQDGQKIGSHCLVNRQYDITEID